MARHSRNLVRVDEENASFAHFPSPAAPGYVNRSQFKLPVHDRPRGPRPSPPLLTFAVKAAREGAGPLLIDLGRQIQGQD